MAHEVAVDPENVFFWNRGEGEREPDAARLRYTRSCLEAVAWWSETHHAPDGPELARVRAIRGYTKLDPAGQSFLGALRLGGGDVRLDRVDEFPKGQVEKGQRTLVLDVDFEPDVEATLTLVGPEQHAGETAMLDAVRATLAAEPGPHRFVLASHDGEVSAAYAAGDPAEVSYLLAYNTTKDPAHVGDPRVATFGHLVSLYLHLDRLGAIVAGEEITGGVLGRLNILLEPAPQSRPKRASPRRVVGPAPVASPVDTLRRVNWVELVKNPPDSPRWVRAWGDADFQQVAATMILRHLGAVEALNDELAACIRGLRNGDDEASHLAYRMFALIAVHYRLPADRRRSLGAMLRDDVDFALEYGEAYLHVQPFLPSSDATTA